MGDKFCGEVKEHNNEEDPEEWLGDSRLSSQITDKKKEMKDVKKYEINVTMGNGQKMKCELKGSINISLQDGQMMKLTKILYMPQAVKNF